jgi:hypothetical protein
MEGENYEQNIERNNRRTSTIHSSNVNVHTGGADNSSIKPNIQEHVQGLRSINKHALLTSIAPQIADEIIYVDCHVDPATQKEFVLWDDILQAFGDAVQVRHQSKVVPYLKGSDFRPYVSR